MKKILVVFIAFFALQLSASTFYVSINGSDSNTGTKTSRLRHIQTAINMLPTRGIHTIYVGPGLYCENLDYKNKNIKIRSEKGANMTIIQGDGTQSVVLMENLTGPATLEGFSITGGSGTLRGMDGTPSTVIAGGGVLVRNCNPTTSTAKKITLSGLKVYGNHAFVGGGIAISLSTGALIDQCEVYQNEATSGGGIWYFYHHSGWNETIRNSLICQNTATMAAGGLGIDYSTKLIMEHVTVADNTAPIGSIMRRANAGAFFAKNCIFSGDAPDSFWWEGGTPDTSFVEYSCIPFHTPGSGTHLTELSGNIYVDPLFRPEYDRYQLESGSPCKDAGTTIASPTTDLIGWPRVFGLWPDMGAYEIPYCGGTSGSRGTNDDGSFGQFESVEESSVVLNEKITFLLYPNPATETVEVVLSDINDTAKVHKVQIFDLTGKLVRELQISSTEQTTIDIRDLPKGIYTVQLDSGRSQKLTRL